MNNPTTTKPTSRYFAAENRSGFANTWDVLVFDSRAARDNYVSNWHGHWDGNNSWKVLAIKKREAAGHASNLNITTGQRYQPRIGGGEFWGIVDDGRHDAPGCIGVLAVCDPDDDAERLWKQT